MMYLVWTTLAIVHLSVMAIARGMERRGKLSPDLFVYALWEIWLLVWVLVQVSTIIWDALRWTFTVLDDIGYRLGR